MIVRTKRQKPAAADTGRVYDRSVIERMSAAQFATFELIHKAICSPGQLVFVARDANATSQEQSQGACVGAFDDVPGDNILRRRIARNVS